MQVTEPPQQLPIDPRIRQRRVEVQRAVGRRRVRMALGAAATATVAAAGLAVVHSSLLGARTLVVHGAGDHPADAVLAAGRLRRGEPLIDVDAAASARGIERLAWVAEATVHRSWPGRVTVTVTARSAVGQLVAAGAVSLVDSTGRVLTVDPARQTGLPVLTGIGAAPGVGSWLTGSAGYRQPVGSPGTLPQPPGSAAQAADTPTEAVLATASGLLRAGVRPSSIAFGPDGVLRAEIDGTAVLLGPPTDLAGKLASLRALARAGALRGAASVDLEVPSRPAVTPAGGTAPSGSTGGAGA